MMKWITPSMAVCDETDWPERFQSDEILLAVDWIEEGGTAFVASDDVAADVLRHLGLTEAEVADRLHFANTGRILV